MQRKDIIEIFKTQDALINSQVAVSGWVRRVRESKTMAFIELNDGTTLQNLQLVINLNNFNNNLLQEATTFGACLSIAGKLVKSVVAKDSIEIEVSDIQILGSCPPDFPIQKKRHTLEYLRTIPHLRVRTNTFNAMLRVRSKLSFAIHKFFQERNYTYVHTPIITASDCEGAGEVFKVTTIGFNNKYKSEDEYYADDFFGKKAGLTVSGQLEGEVAAMSMGKIYTFGPTFRAENSNTPRHAAEFWQIEPEVAYCKLPDIIKMAEEFIKYIISYVIENCPAELAFFEEHYEENLISKLKSVVSNSFQILDYTDAIDLLKKSGQTFQFPVEWGCDLQTEHERYITEKIFNKPVFVINYPKAIKSFYMKQNDDGKTVSATDLLVPGIGEIIGCSEREDNYDKLITAIKDRNMKISDYANYLDLRKYGSCPHSGFGLGLERILMYVTGLNNIRDVCLFPRTPKDLM